MPNSNFDKDSFRYDFANKDFRQLKDHCTSRIVPKEQVEFFQSESSALDVLTIMEKAGIEYYFDLINLIGQEPDKTLDFRMMKDTAKNTKKNHLSYLTACNILKCEYVKGKNSYDKFYLNKDFGYSCGIYIGTQFVVCSIIDYGYNIITPVELQMIERKSLSLEETKLLLCETIIKLLTFINNYNNDGTETGELIQDQNLSTKKLFGICISWSGIVYPNERKVKSTLFHKEKSYIVLKDILNSDLLDLLKNKIYFENNVKAACMSEIYSLNGYGRNMKDFVLIYLSAGIGAGIIVNGRLCRGRQNQSSEIGHHVIEDNIEIEPCTYCKKKCLEVVFRKYIKEGRDLNEATFLKLLARNIGYILGILSPQKVILCGKNADKINIRLLEEYLKDYVHQEDYALYDLIEISRQRQFIITYGSAILAYLNAIKDPAVI